MNTNLHEWLLEPRKMQKSRKDSKPIEFDGFRKQEALNG